MPARLSDAGFNYRTSACFLQRLIGRYNAIANFVLKIGVFLSVGKISRATVEYVRILVGFTDYSERPDSLVPMVRFEDVTRVGVYQALPLTIY